jgi:hypothetical protein
LFQAQTQGGLSHAEGFCGAGDIAEVSDSEKALQCFEVGGCAHNYLDNLYQ